MGDPRQVIYTTPTPLYPGTAVYQTPGYPVAQPYVYQPSSPVGLPAPVVYPAPAPPSVVYPSTSGYQTPTYPVAQPFASQQPQQPQEQSSAQPESKSQAPPEYRP
ncbi:hypothetical protein TELCIR_15246 [Teladorsagia circumcincta]|uniref:Uncharacterized protein n=1 Tax=Teladorsagia circumcincta TaxID=45464 RepID=A0A2G9TYQ6_TELCI|nr:hypothetical protein TELCIR_15246 [Teladorsagia circumcincta]